VGGVEVGDRQAGGICEKETPHQCGGYGANYCRDKEAVGGFSQGEEVCEVKL
jgi:hypothetical protein